MEIPSSTDDGEPAQSIRFRIDIFFLSALLLLAASCTQKQKETKEEKTVPDSTIIKQQQKRVADSLAKLVIQKKKIYLTFDDGPNDGTMNVLNAVKEDSIPVSFFVVGKHVFDSPQQSATWKELQADSAIELCNHSYTHALNHYSKYYQHPGAVVKDIERNQDSLDFDSRVVRMPGRNAWRIDLINRTDIKESKVAIDAVHNAGFAVMGWDVEWMFDHKTLSLITDTELLLRRIENMLEAEKTKTPGHLVLLAHDQAFQTHESVVQLHYLFQHLKNNPEYELVLAGNYPGVKK